MKADWEVKKLGEVCEIKPQKTEARKRLNSGDSVSFVPMEDLGIGRKYLKPKQTKSLQEVVGSYTYFADGDVLLAKITPCFENGKLGIARSLSNGIGFGSSEYIVFRPHKFLLNEYLYYFLSREQFREEGAAKMSGAVGHKRVNKDFIEEYLIPFPPLAEQKRIVAILDEAFAAIDRAKANAETNVRNARALFESYLQAVFANPGEGWEEKTLGRIAEFRNGLNFTKSSKGESIKIVGVKDFQKKYWVPFDDLESVTLDGYLNETDRLREGDILAVRSNGNQELIGRCILAGPVPEKTSHSGFTIRIRLNSKGISPLYLCHYLKSQKARKQLVASGSGTNIKSLNQGALSSLVIPVPSFDQQKTIVQQIEDISIEAKKLEAIYRQKLADLDELKKAILQKAFRGELSNTQGELTIS